MNGWNRVGLASVCVLGAMIALGSPAGGIAIAQPSGQNTETKTVTVFENDGKRTVKLEIKNGEVRTAEIDGKSVPADRIERDGGVIRLKNDAGDVVYEYDTSAGGAGASARSIRGWGIGSSSGAGGTVWSTRPFNRGLGSAIADPDATVIRRETPKVMIGVQLVDPDPALRGHFGLKRGEGSMVAAVYEGLPASNAGLEPYDIIVGVNGKTPVSTEDVRAALREKDVGASVSMDVIKQGQRKTLNVVPEKYDSDKLESAKRKAVAAIELDEDGPFGMASALGSLHGLHADVQGLAGAQAGLARDMIFGVAQGPDGRPGRALTIEFGEEQREMAERMREMAEEMRTAIAEKAGRLREAESAHKEAINASKDLEAQIKELEASLKRLQDLQQQRRQGKSSSGSGSGGSGGDSNPASPPTPPTPGNWDRESRNSRPSWRLSMA